MIAHSLSIRRIRPWWLKLLVLLSLAFPALTGLPITYFASVVHGIVLVSPDIELLVIWTLYAVLIWGVVLLSSGAKKSLQYLSVAFVTGITTALLGAILRKFFPVLAGNLSDPEVSFKMIKLLLIIVTVIPYTMMSMNCFSASDIISKTMSRKSLNSSLGLHLALALRILQHVGEVVSCLYIVWREEHPDMLIPRHRRNWNLKWYSKYMFIFWFWESIQGWIFACFMHTFEPIPSMVREIENVDRLRRSGGQYK